MNRETMAEYGIDYDRGLKNCMSNLAFYKKILTMFMEDQCYARAKEAYLKGDNKELFSRMHEMKGISGNAALMAIYESSIPLVELLRSGGGTKKELEALFIPFEQAYDRTCEGIRLFITET